MGNSPFYVVVPTKGSASRMKGTSIKQWPFKYFGNKSMNSLPAQSLHASIRISHQLANRTNRPDGSGFNGTES